MSSSGPAQSTQSGDVVTLVLQGSADGVRFVPDADGNACVVESFELISNGKFGPFQKHGGIHRGDVLFEVRNAIHSGSTLLHKFI
jgi:hypothetical protein